MFLCSDHLTARNRYTWNVDRFSVSKLRRNACQLDQNINETRFIVDKVEFDKFADEKLARIANPAKWRRTERVRIDRAHATICMPTTPAVFVDRGNHLFLCQLFPYTIQSQLTFRWFHAGFERRIEVAAWKFLPKIEPSSREEILLFGTWLGTSDVYLSMG